MPATSAGKPLDVTPPVRIQQYAFPPMMMMAHESSPPPKALDEATIETVRMALVRYLATQDDGRDGVRAAITQMANEARDKEILPEQLLVVLKDLWFGLPDLKAAPDHQRSSLLQRVVTLCIKEYYET